MPKGCRVAIAAREQPGRSLNIRSTPKAVGSQRAREPGYGPYRTASGGLGQHGDRERYTAVGGREEKVVHTHASAASFLWKDTLVQ